jgi:hypothetical protein
MLWPVETKRPFEKSMHVSVAGRSPKIVYFALTVSRLKNAPPIGVAVFSLIVTPSNVATPPLCIIAEPDAALLRNMVTLVRLTSESLSIAPPPPPAELPLNVTRFSVAESPFVKRPPPPQPPVQVLSLTVTSMSDRMSWLTMPAPWIWAVFCVTTTLVRLRVTVSVTMTAPLAMPPPAAAPGLPFRIVTPEIDVVPFANTSNTRSMPPPSMIVLAAPAPVMVTAPLMSRSPVAARSSPRPPIPPMVSVYVPAGMTMVSAPPLAFDA